MMPGASGQVTLYTASWDCNEGTIRITTNAEASPDVSVLSSDGTATAQMADGPHPTGRTVYEAPLPEDPILSIRAIVVEGRATSTASETVRTGGQCTGEVVFRAYGAPATAPPAVGQAQPAPPSAADEPPAPPQQPSEQEQQATTAPDEPAATEPPAGQAQPSQEIEVPPPPADPGDEMPDEPAEEQPPATPPATDDADVVAVDEDDDGGCLIATAAYGTEIAPQVQHLREVRDSTLLTTESGRAFMAAFGTAYYAFSPQVADLERSHPAFRQAVAALVAPMLLALQVVDSAEPGSEQSVVAYGALAIALVAGMYVAAPAAGVWYAVRLGRRRAGRKGRSA